MSTKKVVLLVIIVLILLIAMSYCTGRQFSKLAMSTQSSVIVTDNSWLRVNPSGMIADYNEVMPLNFMGSGSANSIQNMTAKIAQAADDKRIKGMILEPGMLQISLPALNELGLAIQNFKAGGKPVYAFGDFISQGDYLLASYADEIFMEPSASAGLLLTGTAVNALFYKELYEKLGIKMHVIQAGEFKGAGEPYNQTSFSEGTRQNIADVLSDRFELILATIAQNRSITTDDVRAVYNNREDIFIRAEQAVEMQLVDHALSRTEMLEKLDVESDKLVSIGDYKASRKMPRGDKIAVVYLNGNIAPGTAGYGQSLISHSKVRKITKDLIDNESVKAVVLRVNSPGGSALESEHIYQELLRLKASKPIIVSMGGVAASGGYYISCAADRIMADAGTITGSIGVIMVLPEATALGRKVGLRSQTIKYGKYAGAMNPFEPYSQEILNSFKQSSIGTYDEFKARVMSARGIAPEKINSIAEGRIYSAEDALAVNLIDEIGSLDLALVAAAEMANLSTFETVNYPVKMSFFEALKDSDFFNLTVQRIFSPNLLDLEKLARSYIEHIEPGTWQYLMPVVVD
jgi:protease IV